MASVNREITATSSSGVATITLSLTQEQRAVVIIEPDSASGTGTVTATLAGSDTFIPVNDVGGGASTRDLSSASSVVFDVGVPVTAVKVTSDNSADTFALKAMQ